MRSQITRMHAKHIELRDRTVYFLVCFTGVSKMSMTELEEANETGLWKLLAGLRGD